MLGDSRDIVGTCRGLHRPPGSTAQEVTPFSIRRSGDGFLRMALESVKTETQDTVGFGTKVAREQGKKQQWEGLLAGGYTWTLSVGRGSVWKGRSSRVCGPHGPQNPLIATPCGFSYIICVLVAQLCLTLCYPMDCSLPGSSCPWNSPGKNTRGVAIPFHRSRSYVRRCLVRRL